jgi:probable F420-dependent oxidoreductase
MDFSFLAISLAPDRLAGMAGELEELGYDAVGVAETSHDPFIALAAAATGTRTLGLRTSIAVAFARNPMTTAMLANDLQLLSQGRFSLGLGSQLRSHITKRFGMPWSQPAARMREYVLALRAIWDCFEEGGPLRFRGQIYRHTLMVPFFNPGPNPYGRPPVLLGGVGELMTETAGEVADGFIAHNISSPLFLREVTLPALRRGRAVKGQTMDGFQLHVNPMVAIGTDQEQLHRSMDRIREQIAFYTATPTYARLLELHGLSQVRTELHRLAGQGRVAEMASVIDDGVLNTLAFVGEPKQVAARLHASYHGTASSMFFYEPAVTEPKHWLELITELRRLESQSTLTAS